MVLELGRKLRAKLASGAVHGAWLGLPHPGVIEIMASSGFDYLLFDGEHSALGAHQLDTLLPATELHGTPVVFRPPAKAPHMVKMALDAGVAAVMVPMIEGAEEAQAIIAAGRYAPLGQRGIGPWRASGYYRRYLDYVRDANDATTLILQIESAAGLANLEAISALQGFEVIYVGPADLASSLGLPLGEFGPKMRETLAHIARTARAAGKHVGIDAGSEANLPWLREMGYSFFSIGSDMEFLMASGQALAARLAAMG